MREIKFRCWSLNEEEMVEPELVSLHGNGEIWIKYNETNMYQSHSDLHFPMQYTGLKDKNSIEIYCGDIINVFDSDTEFLGHGKIIFNDFSWSIEWIEKSGNFTMLFSEWYEEEKTIEVIGNIYENKELLKDIN